MVKPSNPLRLILNPIYCFQRLHFAAEDGDVQTIRVINDRGTSVDAVDRLGNRPIVQAAINGQLEAVRELLRRGADIDAKGIGGDTAISAASRKGFLNVVRLLADQGE